jgi:DNA-binding transcriptional LysR family regulator
MLIRQLEYFVAVARERHFARAAAACYVSQPALSDALRKLEAELDVPLIKRGHAFEGLTPEGERLVVWARRVLADHDALLVEARTLHAGVTGHLRIGVVPSASTTLAELVGRFWTTHPLTTVSLTTKLSTTEIVRRVRTFELDAGICYAHADITDLTAIELYREREVLIASREMLGDAPDTMTWADAALYPLIGLEGSMRLRTIVDDAFERAGVRPSISLETDSIAALYALVGTGAWASVVPDRWRMQPARDENICVVRLTDPSVENSLLLVHNAAEPVSPLVRSLVQTAQQPD